MSKGWIYILASAAISATIGYRYGCVLAHSSAALDGILSVFSILAGVLVAVMSIIGDPSMLLTGNWRLGYEHAKDIQRRISNYAHLIFLYIIILIFVLVATVIKDNEIKGIDIIYNVLLGITTFGLLLSLPLPYSLMAIQKERMNEEVKRRKSQPSQ